MATRVVKDIPSTPHFDFVSGAFYLSSWRIPYYCTTMSLHDAATSLKLATDFPGAESIQWKVEELYQRDIGQCTRKNVLPHLRVVLSGQPDDVFLPHVNVHVRACKLSDNGLPEPVVLVCAEMGEADRAVSSGGRRVARVSVGKEPPRRAENSNQH